MLHLPKRHHIRRNNLPVELIALPGVSWVVAIGNISVDVLKTLVDASESSPCADYVVVNIDTVMLCRP